MTTDTTRFATTHLEVAPLVPQSPALGLLLRARGTLTLGPEQARALRDWLTAWLDDDGVSPGPAAPDAVRLAIDAQRADLTTRSQGQVSEDFRAGLAWADRALRAVAEAATPSAVTS